MKVFVKKEFPLYKPPKSGFYTCDVNPEYNVLNLDLKCDIYFNYLLDVFEYKGAEIKILFFYEETDAYVHKTKHEEKLENDIKLLEARIIDLTVKVYELECNSNVQVRSLEFKILKLHSAMDKLIEFQLKPLLIPVDDDIFKIKSKLDELGYPDEKII